MPSNDDRLPLSGLLVVELTRVIVGPAVGRTLADYGATVIRVQSSHYPDLGGSALGSRDPGAQGGGMAKWNFNKKSVTLNLRNDRGRALFEGLLKQADVFIENNAGGAIDRLGYGYDYVSNLNPSVIMVSTSMFVGREPWSRFRGYGNQTAGLTGFQALIGYPEDTGQIRAMAGPYTDFTSPPLAVAAILTALRHRRRTGKGQYIRQGQGQSVLLLIAGLMLGHQSNHAADDLVNIGNRDVQMVPHGAFEASDGRWCAISVRDAADWAALCGVAGWDDYATDGALAGVASRRQREDEIEERLQAWVASRASLEVAALLRAADVPVGLVLEPDELPAHPQFQHFDAWQQSKGPAGNEYTVHNLPYQISEAEPAHWRQPPTVGEDTYEILTKYLDIPVEEIAGLYSQGILD